MVTKIGIRLGLLACIALAATMVDAAMTKNKLASNKLASNALSSTRLAANQATAEILTTPDGRDVYSYIIGCALSDSTTIEATVPGAPDTDPLASYTCVNEVCTFTGALGLAQHWIDRRLDPKGQRWVSACLLARVNFHDQAEAISLRGLAPELTVSTDEQEIYTVEEEAFFGNLFTDDEGPIDWNACRGEGQASGEFGGLALRDCTEEDPGNPGKTFCGFNYAGDCRDYTPDFPSPYACKSFRSGGRDLRRLSPRRKRRSLAEPAHLPGDHHQLGHRRVTTEGSGMILSANLATQRIAADPASNATYCFLNRVVMFQVPAQPFGMTNVSPGANSSR